MRFVLGAWCYGAGFDLTVMFILVCYVEIPRILLSEIQCSCSTLNRL
jgi:hypothetical protein